MLLTNVLYHDLYVCLVYNLLTLIIIKCNKISNLVSDDKQFNIFLLKKIIYIFKGIMINSFKNGKMDF